MASKFAYHDVQGTSSRVVLDESSEFPVAKIAGVGQSWQLQAKNHALTNQSASQCDSSSSSRTLGDAQEPKRRWVDIEDMMEEADEDTEDGRHFGDEEEEVSEAPRSEGQVSSQTYQDECQVGDLHAHGGYTAPLDVSGQAINFLNYTHMPAGITQPLYWEGQVMNFSNYMLMPAGITSEGYTALSNVPGQGISNLNYTPVLVVAAPGSWAPVPTATPSNDTSFCYAFGGKGSTVTTSSWDDTAYAGAQVRGGRSAKGAGKNNDAGKKGGSKGSKAGGNWNNCGKKGGSKGNQGTSDNLKGGGKGNGIPEGWTAEIQFGDYNSGKIEQFLGRDLQPTDAITTADGEEITGSALKELTGDDLTNKFPIKIKEWRTTLTIRHVPNNHTKYDLIRALDSQGFEARYNFVHLPWDKDKDSNKGYAFVNFDSVEQALLAFEKIPQVQWSQISRTRSKKACEVCWGSSKDQGYEANLKKWAISVWDDKFKPTFGLDCIDAIRHVCV